MQQTSTNQVNPRVDRLRAEAYIARERQDEDPERDQYWEGYLDALWWAIDVMTEVADKEAV